MTDRHTIVEPHTPITIPGDLIDLGAELRRTATEIPDDNLPELVAQLEAAKAIAWGRLVTPRAPTPTTEMPQLVDSSEMARLIMMPAHWVRENARRGRIPCVRLGHYVRFDPWEVAKAIRTLARDDNGKP